MKLLKNKLAVTIVVLSVTFLAVIFISINKNSKTSSLLTGKNEISDTEKKIASINQNLLKAVLNLIQCSLRPYELQFQ